MKENRNVIIINGNIHTMNEGLPMASAAVIEGGRFAFVGTEAGAVEFAAGRGGEYETADMRGAFIIPGLNDSHLHFLHFAKNQQCVNLTGAKNMADIQDRLEQWIEKNPADTGWIEGEGWNEDYFQGERSYPSKKGMDEVTGNCPAIIYRVCHHTAVVNSAGLQALGLNKETAFQYGRLVGFDENGELNGILYEGMLDHAKAQISTLAPEVVKRFLLDAQEEALKQGLTSLQSDDICYMPKADYSLLFQIVTELAEEGLLHLRIGEQCLLQTPEALAKFFSQGYHSGWGNAFFRINCVKLIADGSLGARTAAMRKPYADMPDTRGIRLFTDEELQELVLICHRHSCPAAIHAIGDGAIEQALSAIEYAQNQCPEISGLRHGIVHCQITDEALTARFKELDVTAFIQPIFIEYDRNIAESRVGKEITDTSYAWKTMNEMGIHAPFGTDCPVESFATMPNIYAAVTRKNIAGELKSEFLPEQRMTMEEAIRSYTVEGAYAENQEHEKGMIKEGMMADFVVLDHDLFHLTQEEDILETKVLETWVDGKQVYRR